MFMKFSRVKGGKPVVGDLVARCRTAVRTDGAR